MTKINAFAVLVLGTSLLAGCGILKKKQGEQTPSAATTVAAAPTTPAVVAPVVPTAAPEPTVAVADESVPAPEDFEDEAFEKVSDKTYKDQLAGLKKELEAK
jgi:hypothetical protein